MARLGVKGAVVNGEYLAGDIEVSDGVVQQVGLPPGSFGTAIPGFVDLQVNGFAGVDFAHASSEQWLEANRALVRTGVTHYVANLISTDPDHMHQVLQAADGIVTQHESEGAQLLGMHLEGPFLSRPKAGIHPTQQLKSPSVADFVSWIDSGPVVMTTVAPEIEGATEFIQEAVKRGVVVSLGHSESSAKGALAGFSAGATTVTHIFNAMSGVSARNPGLAGAALLRPDVTVQLIVDFVHVDEVLVSLVIQWAGQRLALVTDCLPLAGTDHTSLTFAGKEIRLENGRAVDPSGVLAGSVLTMPQALRNAVSAGMSEIDAINAATLNPRTVLGKSPRALSPGAIADVVILTDELEVHRVQREHEIYEPEKTLQ